MGDSDDEYDRRRRDKFRRERSDYDRSREREDRRRDDWNDREWDRGRERRSRGEYRDYDRGRRERFSPPRHDMSPQQKRMRRDWDDHGGDPYRGGYDLGYGGGGGPSYGPPQHWGHPDLHLMQPHHGIPIQARLGNIHDIDLGPPPPIMKSFKEFLLSLDDSVDETEAVKRYNEYKVDFRRQQMQDFFLAHKDEEWFRSKYHPDEASRLRAEAQSALHTRLNVFLFLMENGWFDNISLDIEQSPAIIKVLDAAVIKMEGGTDHDLRILDLPTEEEEDKDKPANPSASSEPVKREEPKTTGSEQKPSAEKDTNEKEDGESTATDRNAAAEEREGKDEAEKDGVKEEKQETKKPRRKRKRSGDSDDEVSASESESDSDSDSNSNCSDKPAKKEEEEEEEEVEDKEEEEEEEEGEEEKVKENCEEDEKKKEEEKEKKTKDDSPRPRPLHRTCSLFMRSIAPTISKAEIIALCRRYPGFLRVCLSDPHPERRFFRRCWVTFDRSTNIKEVCWNLQNIRLRDCELAPGVNRDLARRVRNVNGITQHKQVLRNDIKLAAKLIHALDDKGELWSVKMTDDGQSAELPAQNPILKNITDYLIEEVSAEEEELLGSSSGIDPDDSTKEGTPTETTVERDDKLAKVLDRLVLYLRIVHSIDYYNTCEYPSEDEMPNRCGMIHVRGPIPPNRITHGEVLQWEKMVEEKLVPLFGLKEVLSEDEARKMGRKDPEEEVEKFVSANTQELGKDKWLCPLSGKKFKGPEFVRKHILNKHGDKIEEVKKEVSFFNNFLMDAKRPSLPEMKLPILPVPGQGLLSSPMPFPPQGPQGPMGFAQPRPPLLGYPAGPSYPPNQFGGGGRGGYDNFRGQGGYLGKPRNIRMSRGDPRNIIEYRDLDAPDDMDFF
ncbi:serrate RNA effector molecule homolog [Gouania willdenowi]|uniref:serrate RNA effector molecule homolog n=1 Tax=Gouania willdenowi TaxID=441366 RepID=UPI0010561CF9|nr:serrate RNA effector molecule homolog [Gouania willdenowi]XP_028322277.1 serrate RNA effector molecule homolog [Gouania willdenowi]